MDYRYAENRSYEDYASGRVLLSAPGAPNYPARLALELFGRCMEYLPGGGEVTLYDPCCGSAYALTVIGLVHSHRLRRILGSDIDEGALTAARRNLSLLNHAGLAVRREELAALYAAHGKPSHAQAMDSAQVFVQQLARDVPSLVFQADATASLCIEENPDVIIADVPYGALVNWQGEGGGLNGLMASLRGIAHEGTILALSMDKQQKASPQGFERLEKFTVGKRRVEILRASFG